jgi:CDP-6-deoxy-D-xylo-4-hexulose-3-dehydrase
MNILKKNDLEVLIKTLFTQWVELKKSDQIEKIQYAGPILDSTDYDNMLDAIFNDWWSGGSFTIKAEKKLAFLSNRNYGLLANSGSSSNLLLMAAAKELYFNEGDKIITLSCGFPTTVNPIIQNGLIPVFIDIDLETLGVSLNLLEDCIKSDKKIKGIFIAHTLGFKSNIEAILDLGRKYNLQIFFDCCDAYGTLYKGKPIQTYGKAATFSFYAAHHVTMGEGGGVVTNDADLHLAMRGFRNWGRYCSSMECCCRSLDKELMCSPHKLTTKCDLSNDYIVNYQYEWLGYNLKPLELQSAILLSQLDKLDQFNTIRKKNYTRLYRFFKNVDGVTTWSIDDEVSPFAFPMLLDNKKYKRKHLMDFLNQNKIENRLLFGGNLMKHPAYTKCSDKWECFSAPHYNADRIMNDFLMLGVSPVITEVKMIKLIEKLTQFFGAE